MKKFVFSVLIALMFLANSLMAAEATTTVFQVELSKSDGLKPGDKIATTYKFEAEKPYNTANSVFVHIIDRDEKIVAQGDHDPKIATDSKGWVGNVSYTQEFEIPEKLDGKTPRGTYRIVIGLCHKNAAGDWLNETLKTGPGVTHHHHTSHCIVGSFTMAPVPKAERETIVTVLPLEFSQNSVPPGATIRITYNFEADKVYDVDNSVFVHILDKDGRRISQADHLPGIATGSPGWTGKLSYTNDFSVATDMPEGEYRLAIGLYHADDEKNWVNEPLRAGAGVSHDGNEKTRVIAGKFTVDKKAPMPKADTEKAATLDLEGFKLVFEDDFSKPLDVSPWGPGTRWIAHTPWAGDFGDARFANPDEDDKDFPFVIQDGVLRIEARKSETFIEKDGYKRPWAAGLLASNDPKGNGFALQYGYFVARMKMLPGPGLWPAFWLASQYDRTKDGAGKSGSIEIDVIEYYGHFPSSYRTALHTWEPQPHKGAGALVTTKENEPSSGFHDYGVLVEKDFITFYFDGIEVWKQPTPKEHNKPLMLLVNLAMGSGYSIEHTPNPSYLYVEYIRVYALPE